MLSLLAILNPAQDILHPLSVPTARVSDSRCFADASGAPTPSGEGNAAGAKIRLRGVLEDGSRNAVHGAAKKVVVVGAGFAGVSAARRLRGWGYDVVVMEAQNRTGGRVWSRSWPLDEQPDASGGLGVGGVVDLGGMVVTGTEGNPLVALARSHGVALRA